MGKRVIGIGGHSIGVHRWLDTRSTSAVAAKTVPYKKLAIAEIEALRQAEAFGVSRVVKLLDTVKGFAGRTHLILELVEGCTLTQYSDWRRAGTLVPDWDFESNMMTIAVQLLETLSQLHEQAHLAHLDLKGENVMLSQNSLQPWDTLKLIDFGIASACSTDPSVKDVSVPGLTASRAAPENLQMFVREAPDSQHSKIHGPASDVWSAGLLLFEMLTGHVPFDLNAPGDNIPAATSGRGIFDALLAMWASWSNALLSADRIEDIQHPLMAQIKACSVVPELAADFFVQIFNVRPDARPTAAQALAHPYLADCVQEMQRARAGNPHCGYLRTEAEVDILKRIPRASLPARVYKESAKMAKGVAQRLVRFAWPPQHRKPRQQKQAYPPCDLDWYFPPYVMMQRSAAKPALSNARAASQPTAHDSTDTPLDTARHGDMHDSADSLLAVCKGQQNVRKVVSSSSLTTGKEKIPVTAPQLSMTDAAEAQKQLANGPDKTNPQVVSPSQGTGFNSVQSQQVTLPPSSASTSTSKVGSVSTDVGASLDGLLVKPSNSTAAIAVTASCVSSVPDLQRQDSA